MYHLKPEKYKEFAGQNNIIVGKGELVYSENKQGWVDFNGRVIRNKEEAIKLATLIDKLYTKNSIRIATKRNSYR